MADASPAQVVDSPGWQAELDLGFELRAGRTALAHRRHSGPLRVQRPFYPEGEVCHIYVVHPPGGVVAGDRLDIRVDAAAGSHALLTTPAAGKFYRSGGLAAQQSVCIRLNRASLEWLPQETIFHPGARVRTRTMVHIDESSRFIGWDVGCYGLPARGEHFASGQIVQGFEIWLGDKPLLLDRLRLDGAGAAMNAQWGLAGHPVLGTMLAYPAAKADLEALREESSADASSDAGAFGLTLVDGVLVCRFFGHHADLVKRRFVGLWQSLRPRLMQRPALAPRIWAT